MKKSKPNEWSDNWYDRINYVDSEMNACSSSYAKEITIKKVADVNDEGERSRGSQ